MWIVVWKSPINGGKLVDNPLNCVQKLGINTESQVRQAWLSSEGEKMLSKLLWSQYSEFEAPVLDAHTPIPLRLPNGNY